MRTLYLKIFGWFWLATILLVAAVVWSTLQYVQLVGADAARPFTVSRTAGLLERVANQFEGASTLEIADALDEIEERTGVEIFAVDDTGTDLRQIALPIALREALKGDPDSADTIIVRPVTTADELQIRLVADLTKAAPKLPSPGRGLGGVLRGPAIGDTPLAWIRLGVAILVSGLVCYILARYLTRPLSHLRAATARLAAGDLDARVGERIGHRRDEIGELGRDFDAMAERIQRLVESHKRLLRDVSHELRSPLARLQIAHGLARQRSGGTAEAELDRIELEAERLNDLIGQILMLERLEQSDRETNSMQVDLAAVVQEVATDASFEGQQSNRAVEVVSSAPANVRGDEHRLRTAVENVVRNALRFTPEGDRVEIKLEPDGARSKFCKVLVRDHGPGVPEADLPKLFEPFFRSEVARERDRGGHGLGLAITKRCVMLSGGSISASNAADGGLLVEMRLPVARA